MRSDLEGLTIHDRAAKLAGEWIEAVDSFRNGAARDVERTLIPCLETIGAVDRATAIEVGRWAVFAFVPKMGHAAREVRRQHIAGR